MTTTPQHRYLSVDDAHGRMPVGPPALPFAPGDHTRPGPAIPGPAVPGPSAPTEPLAIAALVSAFVVPVVGLVLGVVARRRIALRGTAGRGLALAGIVLGAVFSAMWVVTLVAVLALGGVVSASVSTTPSVPASSVQERIVTQAELAPGSVSCPQDLPATVGAGITCSATLADGTALPIDVRVTSVQGDDVRFDFSSR